MENYNNLIDAIAGLKAQGYTVDFNLRQDCLTHGPEEFKSFHDEFVIDKYFRFEEDTDPSEQSIIYAIHSIKHHTKGILINAYGVYTEPITNEMLNKLNFNS